MIEPNNSQASISTVPTFKLNVGLLLVAVVLASVFGALAIGQIGNVFKMPDDFANMPLHPSQEYMARYNKALAEFHSRNYAVHFSILGSLLGLAIGGVGVVGNRLRSAAAGLIGGAVGAVVGGFLLGKISAYAVEVYRGEAINLWGISIEPILQTTALHCFVWATIGVGIGGCWAAAVWGSNKVLKGVEGGLIGGLLAGVVHSMVSAFLFTSSSGFKFIPEDTTERILWAISCGNCTFLGLFYSLLKQPAKEKQANMN